MVNAKILFFRNPTTIFTFFRNYPFESCKYSLFHIAFSTYVSVELLTKRLQYNRRIPKVKTFGILHIKRNQK